MNALQAYRELSSRSREVAHLDSAMELAYWDQRTNIPAKGPVIP
jgi:Zn-dependent M32 family carboxypeptidase